MDLVHPADREPTEPAALNAMDYVVPVEDTFAFSCPLDHFGQLVGTTAVQGCGYFSSEWPNADLAAKRGAQHLNEHATGEPMPELWFFRQENSITVDADGKASVQTITTDDVADVQGVLGDEG